MPLFFVHSVTQRTIYSETQILQNHTSPSTLSSKILLLIVLIDFLLAVIGTPRAFIWIVGSLQMEAAGGSLYCFPAIWGTSSSLLTVLISMANYQSINSVGELNFAAFYESQCLAVNNTGTRGFTYVFAPRFNLFQCGVCKVWMTSCRMGSHMLKRNNVEGIWVPCCKKLA